MKLKNIAFSVLLTLGVCAFAQNDRTKVSLLSSFPVGGGIVAELQPNMHLKTFKSLAENVTSNVLNVTSGGTIQAGLLQVADGRAQMLWTQSGYFFDKEFSFVLFNQPPFITAQQYLQWRAKPDTVKIADALYAKHGVKAIPCSIIDNGMDFILTDEPSADSPLIGKKISIFGPARDIYTATGLNIFPAPLGELNHLMKMSLIHGANVWSPHESNLVRLDEFAKTLYFPSVIRSFTAVDLFINLRFWNELSVGDRTAYETACRKTIEASLISSKKLGLDAVENNRKVGITVLPLPQKEVQAVRAKWSQMAIERASVDPVFNSLYQTLYQGALNAPSFNTPSQGVLEGKGIESTHRVLLIGGVNLIQESDHPKIRRLYEGVGIYLAQGLRDSLRAKQVYVDSYMPDQRLPRGEFQTNVAAAIVRCKCTMLLQTTLRTQNGSLQFKFEALDLKIDRDNITPQEKWRLTKEFFATEESLSAAIPSEIVKEVADELISKRIFSKGSEMPPLVAQPQAPKVVTRALWDGRQSYNAFCNACHTLGLAGAPRIGDIVTWTPRIALGYPALLNSTAKGKGVMSPQSGKHLDPIEMERALVYLLNQSGGKFAEPLIPPSHAGTHTYTELPPPAPAVKAAPYETLTLDQKILYGERLYEQHCAACHQKNGEGSGPIPPLRNATTFSKNDAVIRAILHGSSNSMMPAWKSYLNNNDIAAVVNYTRRKFGNQAYQDVLPEDVVRLR